MVLSREERLALLEKARAKKKEIAEAKKAASGKGRTLDISSIEDVKKAEENFEIKNELIRIKAPKKKTIIKRVIEVEEPSSEEEIQEEIIKVPKRREEKERKEERKKEEKERREEEEKEREKEREKDNEERRVKQPSKPANQRPNYYNDIFP